MREYVDYTELNTYSRSPEDHYKKYVLGEELAFTPEQKERMLLGTIVGDYVDNPNYDFVKKMKEAAFDNGLILKVQRLYPRIERSGEHQVSLRADLGQGLVLYGKLDRLVKEEGIIDDYKTTREEFAWSQPRVDNDKQLGVYGLLFKENFHRFPKELAIAEINLSKRGRFKRWTTARGPKDLEIVRNWIWGIVDEMQKQGIWEQRKSWKEIELLRKQKNGETLQI